MKLVFRPWHNWLDMPHKNKEWHVDDVADEYQEWIEAKGFIDHWSELSDIVYTVTRARWNGYDFDFPISGLYVLIGTLYMLPKYTSRWLFYYQVGRKLSSSQKVTEVRNPIKLEKLHHIARKYDLDQDLFAQTCRRQLKYWPLLK